MDEQKALAASKGEEHIGKTFGASIQHCAHRVKGSTRTTGVCHG